jgi:hypothetical protein
MIVGLCERFGCLPSALLAEDVSLLRWLRIVQAGTPEPEPAGHG